MAEPKLARWRTLPVQVAAITALILIPVWYRFPYQPTILSPFYATRFWLFLPVFLTCGLFVLMGLPGVRTLASRPWRAAWAFLILALAVWMYASAGWAFRRDVDPALAVGAAVQFATAAIFAVTIASVRLPPAWVCAALVLGLFWNAILVGQQSALQGAAGGIWTSLGEFPIGINQPRISVVQADGVRWLRPYGLLPHPNILAGFLVMGVLAAMSWFANANWRRWLPGGIVVSIGLWALLLTFSRGAYLSLAVGGIALLVLMKRSNGWTRQLAIACLVILMIGVAFSVTYYPYLLARAGEGAETTEQYSLGERTELNNAALVAIGESPIVGVGAGNLPWRSAYVLAERNSIVQGNYPHNVWLTVLGETGIIGIILFGGAISCAIVAGVRALRNGTADASFRAAVLAGFIALIIAGMFDYYPVTFFHFQVGWWALAAAALAPSSAAVLDS